MEFQSSKDVGGHADKEVLSTEIPQKFCFNHQKMWGDMPTVPKKPLEFALQLILAHSTAHLYRACEPRMAQTQKPCKPALQLRLRHALSARELALAQPCSVLRGLRTVITSNRVRRHCQAHSFTIFYIGREF
jgi:hypothetical protein